MEIPARWRRSARAVKGRPAAIARPSFSGKPSIPRRPRRRAGREEGFFPSRVGMAPEKEGEETDSSFASHSLKFTSG